MKLQVIFSFLTVSIVMLKTLLTSLTHSIRSYSELRNVAHKIRA